MKLPALWVHGQTHTRVDYQVGQTHTRVDYQVGQTRVVTNCLGYEFNFWETAGVRPDLVVDV